MRKVARGFLIFLLSFLLANTPGWQAAVAADLFYDSTQQWLDQNGNPLSSGTLGFFDAGTSSTKTTYQDAGETTPNTNPVVLGSDGRLQAPVYIATGDFKLVLKDQGGVTIRTEDDIPGALDTSTFSTEFAKPQEPVVTLTSATTLQTTDAGKVINGDATGGAFTVTLPSAVLVGNGKEFPIRRTSLTGIVSITTTGGQTINGGGSTLQLLAANQVIRLVSDGANWWTLLSTGVVPGSINDSDLNPAVTGRLMPLGAVIQWPGTQTGSPTCPLGHLEADGAAVSRNDFADLYNLYSNDGASPAMYGDGDGSTTFNLPDYRGRFLRHLDGTAGLDPDKATRTDRGDGTTGNNVGTKQGDDYLLHLHADGTLAWSQSTGTASNAGTHNHVPGPGAGVDFYVGLSFTGIQDIGNAAEAVPTGAAVTNNTSSAPNHTHPVSVTGSVSGSTANAPTSGGNETRPKNIYIINCVFASVAQAAGVSTALNTILTGPNPPSDSLGNDGDLYYDTVNYDIYTKAAGTWTLSTSVVGPTGIRFDFSNSTDTGVDPGVGKIVLNNADVGAATLAAISKFTATPGNPTVGNYLNTLDDSTAAAKGNLKLAELGNPENFVLYTTVNVQDFPTYVTLQLLATSESAAAPFADADPLVFEFSRTGDDGAVGPAGANLGLDYSWSTATSGDPGSGNVLLNAGSTALHISKLNRQGVDNGPIISGWDDSTTTGNRGQVKVLDLINTGSNFLEATVTGALVDQTTYFEVPVSVVLNAGSLTNGEIIGVAFARTGDAGSMTGPADSADSEIAIFNGTTGSSVKRPGTSHVTGAKGTTAQRPGTPAAGDERYNTDDNVKEVHNGTAFIQLGNFSLSATVFNANGSLLKSSIPPQVTTLMVECWGGGGSGGGGDGSNRGTGGGGGGYAQGLINVSDLDTETFVLVGAGGAGVAANATPPPGNVGGVSQFGDTGQGNTTNFVVANGGTGGLAGSASAQGGVSGGTASVNSPATAILTSQGGFSFIKNTATAVSGGGHATRGGFGGVGNVASPGSAPGGAGANGNHVIPQVSGAGAAGKCIAWYAGQ